MLDEDFQAECDQHDAAGDLRELSDSPVRRAADNDPPGREQPCDQRDRDTGLQHRQAESGKGEAGGQCIDAGGDRGDGQGPAGEHGRSLVSGQAARFPQHLETQTDQQDQRDPVIEGTDLCQKGGTEHPAEKGHDALCQPEHQPDPDRIRPGIMPGGPLRDRDGKGVHSEADGDSHYDDQCFHGQDAFNRAGC